MNGRDLTLGLVGALAVGSLLGRRGSRATARPPAAFRDLAAWTAWARTQGVELRLAKTPSYTVEITDLFADTTGTGAGTRVMQALVQAADKAGMPLTLHPSSRRNVTFYERFGFGVTGRDGMMRREPKARGSRATDPTSSPAFRRWFGASRVVDAEGRPRVVYHGTTAGDFDAFRPNYRKGEQLGFGIHFAADREFAAKYAEDSTVRRKGKAPKVYEVYLSIQRPLVADAIVYEGTPEFALAKKLAGSKLYTDRGEDGVRLTYMQRAIDQTSAQRAEKLIREAGYDGILYESVLFSSAWTGWGVGQKRTGSSRSYIVFEPTQIKSATGNRGTFDPADPRISYNRAPATDAALRTLRAAMIKAAQADTAYAPAKWRRAKDPLTGHCYGAAHIVQDRFGGEIVKGVVRGQAHAWNRLPGGREVDLTGSQYGGDGLHPLVEAEGVAASRSTNPRFARFAARVDAYLAWG